jgi:hypothetical protein
MTFYEFNMLGHLVSSTEEGILPNERFTSIAPPAHTADQVPVFAHTSWYLITKAEADQAIADAAAAAAAYVPPKPTQYSRVEFMSLFTQPELVAIYTAAKTNVEIEIFLDFMKAAEFVSTLDPRTIAGVQALETATLIAAGRANEILNIIA